MARKPKSLFSVASSAVRKQARRDFQRSSLGKALAGAKREANGSPMGRALRRINRQVRGVPMSGLNRDIERYGLHGYAMQAVNALLGAFGPFGRAIAQRLSRKRPSDQLEAAADLLRSYGMEILHSDTRNPGYGRGEMAARQLLEQAGYRISPQGDLERDEPVTERRSASVPAGNVQVEQENDQEEQMPEVSPLIRTPGSSNVYSFQYNYKTSTLYVRYQAHRVNRDAVELKSTHGLGRVKGSLGRTVGGKTGGPGPMYAYFDVPVRVFERIIRHQSAGGAVWDDLRIRGTAYGHQYAYSLVDAQEIETKEGKGYYVPRKITSSGYRQRSFAPGSGAGRGYALSSLPREDRDFRGRPDAPNRGRAFNAKPFRGRGQ